MSNKINGVDTRLGPVSGPQPVARTRSLDANEPGSTGVRDGVQITDGARQLAALEKAIAAMPVVDQTRVDAVARDIDDGRYAVQPQKIADRLIRMDQEFTAAARRER
jgi:negative regulator of flagellin synthesis FlgM